MVAVAFRRQAAVNDHDLIRVGVVVRREVPGTMQRETEPAIRRGPQQRAEARRHALPKRKGRYQLLRLQVEDLQLMVFGVHNHQTARKLPCMFPLVVMFIFFVVVLVHVRFGAIAVVTTAGERQYEYKDQRQSAQNFGQASCEHAFSLSLRTIQE